MKKLVFIFCLLVTSLSVPAQFEKDSSHLINRLESFFKQTRSLDFDKVIEYLYPRIFTISTKEEVKSKLEAAFTNEKISIKIDSLKLETIFPIFKIDTNRYAKIIYTMVISMKYKENVKDSSMKSILEAVQGQFGKDNTSLVKKGRTLFIYQTVAMAAIIDNLSPQWTFIRLDTDDQSLESILSKDLLAHFFPN